MICYSDMCAFIKIKQKKYYEEIEKNVQFKIKKSLRQLTFMSFEGIQFTGWPILPKEIELSNYLIYKRFEYGPIYSNCRKK